MLPYQLDFIELICFDYLMQMQINKTERHFAHKYSMVSPKPLLSFHFQSERIAKHLQLCLQKSKVIFIYLFQLFAFPLSLDLSSFASIHLHLQLFKHEKNQNSHKRDCRLHLLPQLMHLNQVFLCSLHLYPLSPCSESSFCDQFFLPRGDERNLRIDVSTRMH